MSRLYLYFVSSRERPWRHWTRYAPKDTRCNTHPLCVNPGVPFWTREKTCKLRARWQASSSGIRADVTVVLEVRQSIGVDLWNCIKIDDIGYYVNHICKNTCHIMGHVFNFLHDYKDRCAPVVSNSQGNSLVKTKGHLGCLIDCWRCFKLKI